MKFTVNSGMLKLKKCLSSSGSEAGISLPPHPSTFLRIKKASFSTFSSTIPLHVLTDFWSLKRRSQKRKKKIKTEVYHRSMQKAWKRLFEKSIFALTSRSWQFVKIEKNGAENTAEYSHYWITAFHKSIITSRRHYSEQGVRLARFCRLRKRHKTKNQKQYFVISISPFCIPKQVEKYNVYTYSV